MKTETKHTPGPWTIVDNRYVKEDEFGGIIARVDGKNLTPNIQLISAAPELFEVALMVVQNCNLCMGAGTVSRFLPSGKDSICCPKCGKARAAIAKARGPLKLEGRLIHCGETEL